MRSEEAKMLSLRFKDTILAMRDYNPAETALVDQLAQQFRDWFEASVILDEQGLITVGSQGQPRTHPALDIKNSASDRMERWLRQAWLAGRNARSGRCPRRTEEGIVGWINRLLILLDLTQPRTADGYMFDTDKADRAMRFFGLCLQHQKGKFAGNSLNCLDWQKNLIATIFGWVDDNGLRRFKRVWLEVPRKNGKSTLSSGLGLYMLFADGEKGAEVVSAASDREQARIVFDVAAGMVRADPLLAKSSKVLHNTIRNTLTGGTFKVLSADAGTKHGMNLSGLIFDEVHTQKNRDLWDTLHTSQGSREQPLSVAITTAGHDQKQYCLRAARLRREGPGWCY
jgi:hypothetical protein